MAVSRQHAAPAAAERPPVPEPALSERGRTLVRLGRLGTLATHSRKQTGYPFASVMPYADDGQGRPLFLISSMAMHTQNLKADARASLLVAADGGDDPLGTARITLLGNVLPVPEAETDATRQTYLRRHENARYWADFEDFDFYRLEPAAVYYIGGFGVMGWVPADEYATSEPDPLSDYSEAILRHMNEDHGEALLLLAQAAGESGVEAAAMTSIDRLGFQLHLRSGGRTHGMRIGFPREARTSAEVRTVLVEMVHAARNPR